MKEICLKTEKTAKISSWNMLFCRLKVCFSSIFRLQVLVEEYVKNTDKEAVLSVGSDMRKINYAFHLLKVSILIANSSLYCLYKIAGMIRNWLQFWFGFKVTPFQSRQNRGGFSIPAQILSKKYFFSLFPIEI